MAEQSRLPNNHSYKIAVATGLVSPSKSNRPQPPIPIISKSASDSTTSSNATIGAHKEKEDGASSITSASSYSDDIFTANGTRPTTATSTSASAFAAGWKAAMHQTQLERPVVYSDIDRFALDLTETLGEYLAAGKQLNKNGVYRGPDLSDVELFYPALFRSVCICDTTIMGHPVALHSKHFALSPRGLRVGKAQFLNLPRKLEHACHLSARKGANKRTEYVLEYSNALLSTSKDKSSYVVATQMDVTGSISTLAEILNARFWLTEGERGRHDGRRPATRVRQGSASSEIDWCEIAREQPDASRSSYNDLRHAKDELIMNDANVRDFLEMIEDIRMFHQHYFTLSMAQEPTGPVWQINYISPSLQDDMEDVKASFGKTGPREMMELGEALVGSQAATRTIRWGINGRPMRLYCCPMLREVKTCWLCFLVSQDQSNLWDLPSSEVPSP